jgi:tetratricopeptide (TPR) repeat protein
MSMETRGATSAVRRRWAAMTAAVVFVSCLLILVGLGLVVLVAFAIAAAFAFVQIARDGRLRERLRPLPAHADEAATVEMAALSGRTVYGRPPLPTRQQVADTLRRLKPVVVTDAQPEPAPAAVSPSSLLVEGSRCNALGIALRRAGSAQEAATLHEAARLMFAGVGDRRGEALTANALGAALVEVGKQDAALEQFEEARTMLHALGDRHMEGKVLANIALAKRRAGDDAQADDFLRSALQKLLPQTEAYRRVEQQLRRAS